MLLFHGVNQEVAQRSPAAQDRPSGRSWLSWYSRRKVTTSLACLSIFADRRLSPAATALTTPGSSESSRRSALCMTAICAVSGFASQHPGIDVQVAVCLAGALSVPLILRTGRRERMSHTT